MLEYARNSCTCIEERELELRETRCKAERKYFSSVCFQLSWPQYSGIWVFTIQMGRKEKFVSLVSHLLKVNLHATSTCNRLSNSMLECSSMVPCFSSQSICSWEICLTRFSSSKARDLSFYESNQIGCTTWAHTIWPRRLQMRQFYASLLS